MDIFSLSLYCFSSVLFFPLFCYIHIDGIDKCEHGIPRHLCSDCQICEHGAVRKDCYDCGICEHGKPFFLTGKRLWTSHFLFLGGFYVC